MTRTVSDLDDGALARVIGESLGPSVRLSSWSELTGGTFNTVCRVTVVGPDGPADVVVKIAPRPGTPVLTYEQDLLRTEALVLTRAAEASVPAPTLVHAGFDRRIVDADYLVLDKLTGRPLSALGDRLAPADRRRLRTDLGRHVAALHRVTGDRFGYPQPSSGLQRDTWREAFVAMVGAVLDDAYRFGVTLPVPAEAIRRTVAAGADSLDAVGTPALVHFDLWDGNVFVAGDDAPRIEGLIDAERALWGDPHAELASLTLLGDLDAADPVLTGYRDAGGRVEVDASLRRRLCLYRAYLDLVMLVEAAPRGYALYDHAPVRALCEAHLCRQLRLLGAGG